MTLREIADLIVSPSAESLACGNYLNRRNIPGYYMQLKCGGHWCKVSVSNAERHSDRITVQELDSLDITALQPAVTIPTCSIAVALQSPSAEQAQVNTYLNSSAVEGIWSEFYHRGNWYMVSVSHVEVPAHLSPAELDRIADDLLWQQTRTRRPRRL